MAIDAVSSLVRPITEEEIGKAKGSVFKDIVGEEKSSGDKKNVDSTTNTSVVEPGSGVAARQRLLDALVMAVVAMKNAGRNNRTTHRDQAFSMHMDAAKLQESSASKAFLGGIIGGVAGIAGGVAGVKFSVKSLNVTNGKGAAADLTESRQSALAQSYNSKGQAYTQISGAGGNVVGAITDFEASKDDANASRIEAMAQRVLGQSDDATEVVTGNQSLEDKALAVIDDLRRSETDTNKAILD